MNHSYFKDRLSGYLDRELKPEEEFVVREHLEGCAECRAELDHLKKIDGLVAEHSGLDDGEYWERAAQKIERRLGIAPADVTDITKEKTSQSSGLWWKLTAVAASVVFLTVIGIHQSEILKDEVIPQRQLQKIPAPPAQDTSGRQATDTATYQRDTEIEITPTGPEGLSVDERTEEFADEADVKQPSAEAGKSKVSKSVAEIVQPAIAKPTPIPEPTEDADYRGRTVPRAAEETPAPILSETSETKKVKGGAVENILAPKEQETLPPPPSRQVSRPKIASPEVIADQDAVRDIPLTDLGRNEVDSGVVRELASLRALRDSLVTVMAAASDSLRESAAGEARAAARSAFQTEPKRQSLVPQQADDSQKWNAEWLVDTWYRIALLTPDSTERAQGIKYLREVAAGERSLLRERARAYPQEGE
ncbi:MAG: zf-HC2 domain-containing protein, partial [candidate division Zixibacteria bacterium]|nr:zf-HC2 domain-containing protein [candidate division Zixibacteria bacterium]